MRGYWGVSIVPPDAINFLNRSNNRASSLWTCSVASSVNGRPHELQKVTVRGVYDMTMWALDRL